MKVDKNKMTSSRLIIFLKNPVAGRVKTRLAADIGADRALKVYIWLLKHTLLEASKFLNQYKAESTEVALYFSDTVPARNDFPLEIPEGFRLYQQSGQGLGRRMKNAFEEGFSQSYVHQVIIGSDCPQLAAGHLQQAFDALSVTDTVIGPARDGGYYLLGMNRSNNEVFDLAEWSHNKVFEQTISRIRHLKLSYTQLEELNDIDTVKDLERLGDI
jgi:rSAM/selenodomain-associated transferase 1